MKKISVLGMGPGDPDHMTLQAQQILKDCDVIVGYTVYIELLKEIFPEKEFLATGMRMELERCRLCYQLASEGKWVALVCSGDAGVYGLAAPMYELYQEYKAREAFSGIELETIPGITAANSGAAVLGAPLNHDYCVISLSDLLTPWETIEKRLKAAVMGDFAMAIYNPSSHKRPDHLKRACDILLAAGAEPDRACGYVRNIGREGMESGVMTLKELRSMDADMFTTVFVGNSQSVTADGALITKRGYRI